MSLQTKLALNWEAHLEALPLATWIVRFDDTPSQSQNQNIQRQCGPVFLNQACRELLGLSGTPDAQESWLRYVHPEDQQACLVAWNAFVEGRSPRFHRLLRWIRPDTKEVVNLAARAQKLLCGDIQGWLRSAAAEEALSRLEGLTHARR